MTLEESTIDLDQDFISFLENEIGSKGSQDQQTNDSQNPDQQVIINNLNRFNPLKDRLAFSDKLVDLLLRFWVDQIRPGNNFSDEKLNQLRAKLAATIDNINEERIVEFLDQPLEQQS